MRAIILVLVICCVLIICGYLILSNKTYYSGPVSDHFDGKKFFNPYDDTNRPFSKFLLWQWKREKEKWPEAVTIEQYDSPPQRVFNGIRISFVGHVTFLIQVDGINILTDPVWSDRAGPFGILGPKRVIDPGIKFEDLPPIDLVLVSHNHYDHMDINTLEKLHKGHSPMFITPLGNDTIIKDALGEVKVQALDWYESYKSENNIEVTVVSAVHWSSRFSLDRNKALWGGFIINTPKGVIYFSGDTALGGGKVFMDIAARFPKIDYALIGIGTYEPKWFMKSAHICPEESMIIYSILKPKLAIGMHHHTFQLSDESIETQTRDFEAAISSYKIDRKKFLLPKVGEVIVDE